MKIWKLSLGGFGLFLLIFLFGTTRSGAHDNLKIVPGRTGRPERCVIVSESGFSKQLEQFIAEEIASLEQLEILLFVSGNPHKWWTVQDVYNVVKSSLQSVAERLNEMVERGFLRKETDTEVRYQFAPSDENIWNITSELRNAYKEKSVKVVQAIYSKPPDAVQEFAKAFRLRKDK